MTDDDLAFPESQVARVINLFGPSFLVEITGPAERFFDQDSDSFPVTFIDRNGYASDTYYELRCKLVPVGPVARALLETKT